MFFTNFNTLCKYDVSFFVLFAMIFWGKTSQSLYGSGRYVKGANYVWLALAVAEDNSETCPSLTLSFSPPFPCHNCGKPLPLSLSSIRPPFSAPAITQLALLPVAAAQPQWLAHQNNNHPPAGRVPPSSLEGGVEGWRFDALHTGSVFWKMSASVTLLTRGTCTLPVFIYRKIAKHVSHSFHITDEPCLVLRPNSVWSLRSFKAQPQ